MDGEADGKVGEEKELGCTSAIGGDHLACGQRGQDRKGDDQDIAGIQQGRRPRERSVGCRVGCPWGLE